MASDRPAIPMLEAFLRQLEPPAGAVSPEVLDWPLAIGACLLLWAIPAHGYMFFPGFLAAWLVILVRRNQRNKSLQSQPPEYRQRYERWRKVKRMAALVKDRRLPKRASPTVLLALEQAARSWHDAREALQAIAVTDPEFAAELQAVVDTSMMVAAACADPVVLREEQTRRDLEKMEADKDLVNRIRTRIMQEQARMQMLLPDTQTLEIDTPQALRNRLDRAKAERQAALAELDAIL